MKKKTMLVIGIMGILFAVGATSVAMAQITSSHECTPEMMKDMAKNCPEQMMQSENKAMMGNSMQACTPEMMKDMAKNGPEQMMQSENKAM
ncbi:MAG: hypothetical protein K8F55_13915, partial [Candidatus Methanoperedens nitroreducens]|nr:hypothetical protein [Candidatus Methanoperedens nitroreducens]